MSRSCGQKSRSVPLSIRFTETERTTLERKAGGLPLGAYIKGLVLDPDAKPVRQRQPVKDGEALGQVLAMLGKSRLANNLNQLAKAANLGALPVQKETEDDLREACAQVREMRLLLLYALGIQILESVELLSERFAEATQPAADELRPPVTSLPYGPDTLIVDGRPVKQSSVAKATED